ncbi:MAG: beta-1,4-xylanase [Clostridium sp.]|uniref:beta-1,4-xylanase n=1 Tax=Clostridium sp. TaxID=1506 RepID=UPI0039EA417E
MYKKSICILLIIFIIFNFIIFRFITRDKINSNNLDKSSQFLIGVNIHFLKPSVQEVNKLQDGGFKIVRRDLSWGNIEKKKGVYDFSQYDKLVKSMSENNIKILFILDYSNPLYDKNLSPYTNNGRKAFANFAKAAVEHYKGKQIIWEIWNEPNITFWKPKPNVDNYFKLVIETITAIKSKDKNAFIMAPALSTFDYDYLNCLGKYGLFKLINAISIHPYRAENPETIIDDYKRLRDLIQKYPHNKNIEISSGEWGYSTSLDGMNDIKQAQYCIRSYLINIMCGININIWYDWRDDGIDKNNIEDNFGIVYNDLTPKPSYYAIKTMNKVLDGYRYIKRIDVGSKDDYVLMFEKNNKMVYALWTTGKDHNVKVDLKSKKIEVIDFIGKNYSDKVSNKEYKISIDENVKYILN